MSKIEPPTQVLRHRREKIVSIAVKGHVQLLVWRLVRLVLGASVELMPSWLICSGAARGLKSLFVLLGSPKVGAPMITSTI